LITIRFKNEKAFPDTESTLQVLNIIEGTVAKTQTACLNYWPFSVPYQNHSIELAKKSKSYFDVRRKSLSNKKFTLYLLQILLKLNFSSTEPNPAELCRLQSGFNRYHKAESQQEISHQRGWNIGKATCPLICQAKIHVISS